MTLHDIWAFIQTKEKEGNPLPDFVIKTPYKNFIVECKSYMSNKVQNEKWHFYK